MPPAPSVLPHIAASPPGAQQVLIASNPSAKYKGWILKGTVNLSCHLLATTMADARRSADLATQNNLHVAMGSVIAPDYHNRICDWIGLRVEHYEQRMLARKGDSNGQLLVAALAELERIAAVENPLVKGVFAGTWRSQLFQGYLSTRGPIFWTIFTHFLGSDNATSAGKSSANEIEDSILRYTPVFDGDREENSLAVQIHQLCHDRGIISLDEKPTADLTPEQEKSVFAVFRNRLNKVATTLKGTDGETRHPSATYAECMRGRLDRVTWATYNSSRRCSQPQRTSAAAPPRSRPWRNYARF
jgi:hypothetical protein